MVAAARLLLCGQIVGAAAIARNQLERWTMHRAFNGAVTQERGESASDYIARAWSTLERIDTNSSSDDNHDEQVAALHEDSTSTEEPKPDHLHVDLSDGREVCPALLYAYLSEIMHGRRLPAAIGWDGDAILKSNEPPDEVYAAAVIISDTFKICLRQIRIAIGSLAETVGDARVLQMLREVQDEFSTAEPVSDGSGAPDEPSDGDWLQSEAENAVPAPPPGTLAAPPLFCLMPLLPREGLAPTAVTYVEGMAETFDAVLKGQRPAGRLFRDDELLMYAFAWHRAAAVRAARAAIDAERQLLSDSFDLDTLSRRATEWVLLTEVASLIGHWRDQSEIAVAAALVGSALRSAYWLWLEDDDRAMSALRCVLEQCARLRVWRLKPTRASTLEERPQTMPRDWLEAAGWRRLRALNRALGEFAHVQPNSRWTGARELLAELQVDADPDIAIYTARGASIDFVATLVAHELIEHMRILTPPLAQILIDLFEECGLQSLSDNNSLNELFNHMWTYRSAGLGRPDFYGPGQR